MGRPLTGRWIGIGSDPSNIVLTPNCNIHGTVGPCWILKQVGSNKYVVRNIADPSKEGQIRLTNGVVDEPGTGYLRWETNNARGFVKSITDRKIKTFHGATIDWSIREPGDTVAHVVSNSSIR